MMEGINISIEIGPINYKFCTYTLLHVILLKNFILSYLYIPQGIKSTVTQS